MRINTLLFILLIAGCCSSCMNSSTLFIEKAALEKSPEPIEKIVSIDPAFFVIGANRKKAELAFIKSDQKESRFNEILKENARRCGLDFVLVDSDDLKENGLSYFNHLQPLQQQILHANFNQEIEYDPYMEMDKGLKSAVKPAVKFFKPAPAFSTSFSHLAEEYGTPYFAVHGVFSKLKSNKQRIIYLVFLPPLGVYYLIAPPADTFYFHVVVNVETGNTVYREVREGRVRASPEVLNSIIYDSFNLLTSKR